MLNPLGYVRAGSQHLQRLLIKSLGGHDPVTVRFLIYRANLLADHALSGRFEGETESSVRAQVAMVRAATRKLDRFYGKYQGIKRGICRVEVISPSGERFPTNATCTIDEGVGGVDLLAKNLGLSVGLSGSSERGGLESDLERWKVSGGESI